MGCIMNNICLISILIAIIIPQANVKTVALENEFLNSIKHNPVLITEAGKPIKLTVQVTDNRIIGVTVRFERKKRPCLQRVRA